MYKYYLGSIASILLIFGLVPFKTTMVPEWKILVIDENKIPQKSTRVRQIWAHYSFESEDHEETLVTDDNGFVIFPERKIQASLFSRLYAMVLDSLKPFFRHSSFGIRVTVFSPDNSDPFIGYNGEGDLPTILVLKE